MMVHSGSIAENTEALLWKMTGKRDVCGCSGGGDGTSATAYDQTM